MAVTVDQASIGTFGNVAFSTTIVLTTSAAVASNGFIVLFVGAYGAAADVSSVSGGGLTWTVDLTGGYASTFPSFGIASAPAPSGLASSTAITVTYASSVESRQVAGSSFLGVDLADPVDVAGAVTGSDTGLATAWTTGSLSVAAGSLVVGMAFNENLKTSTPTAPSAELFDMNLTGTEQLTAAYRIESGAGSVAVAGTLSGGVSFSSGGVAYNAGAAAAQQVMARPFNPIPFL